MKETGRPVCTVSSNGGINLNIAPDRRRGGHRRPLFGCLTITQIDADFLPGLHSTAHVFLSFRSAAAEEKKEEEGEEEGGPYKCCRRERGGGPNRLTPGNR